MNETWDFVSFKDLIVERKDKFEPNSPEIEGLTKIEKIDFAEGRLHLGEYEPTKTQQIIVQPGDFVFSGLNIEKGAVAFNETGQRLVVSANYSTCQYDDRKVSLDFFKHYMRSSNFQRLLKDNLKKDYGFTRPKHLLPLTFSVPKSKEEQSLIVRRFERSKNTLTQVTQEIAQQVDLVAKLKQAILQEAITGRLTAGWRAAQTDVEPASQLLARIRAEKARLVAAKKLRPEKPLPPIPESEIPFELPDGWGWCRFGDIQVGADAGSSPKCDERPVIGSEWGILKVSATSGARFNQDENKFFADKLEPDHQAIVREGDFILSRANTKELVGNSVIVERLTKNLLLSDKTVRFRLTNHANKSFANLVNKAKFVREHFIAGATGTSPSMKNISRETILSHLLPLPPLREQTEIVARVEGLMERCRELEAEIERSRAQAAALLQAVLREAFAPATVAA